ncbi:uncharacterized protein RHOBADRAFT_42296 [Rhodotorula graminis WP1]|uniref:Citrate synthase n=1 Tax=Rhodotorula graminis (strain WP1) TaxID=578459 RepID=A0A194S9E3_RHOGW|nr:uncharacterized protein RHOBADRAFT_42296 [Rhodotorula graminis WP1]KPV77085.1 hypothetical protein RHOBADRAFT_42296 [Rhodotorula graminis WP1]
MGLTLDDPHKPRDSLTVTDNRTGKTVDIPISRNSVPATAFKKLSLAKAREGQDRPEDEVESGLRVFDAGYQNTAVVQSAITFIDGEAGVLRHRGYPIEQLADKSTFLETAYLLLYGELPTSAQYKLFSREVMHHTFVHRDMADIVASFRFDSHPMAILTASFAALGAYSPEGNPALAGQKIYTAPTDAALRLLDKQIFRLIGKSITLAAMAYRMRQGRQFVAPPAGMGYAESFLYMMDHLNEGSEYRPHPTIAKALDTLFLLHADHEMNASCAAVLQVGSTLVDPYSAVSAGCAALYGPSHGGANEAVIRMLVDIGSPDNVPAFIERVKRKEAVLSGFGHRVYVATDPRSKIIQKIAEDVFALTGKDPLLDTALALRDAALKDSYFISRRLYPNVDFFSGLIYRVLGFPTDFFPVLFAVPRVVGWLAHWRQMMLAGTAAVKIWRPRQVYVGEGERNYVGMKERGEEGAQQGKKKKERGSEPSKVHHPTSTRVFLARESKL